MLVGGRMVQGRVEGNEVVPGRLHLRATSAHESELFEDVADLLGHQGARMAAPTPTPAARKRQVALRRHLHGRSLQLARPLIQQLVQAVLDPIGLRPRLASLLRRQVANTAQQARKRRLAPQVGHTHLFQLLRGRGSTDRRRPGFLELAQLGEEVLHYVHGHHLSRASLATLTRSPKPLGSRTARSARDLRFSSIPAVLIPFMNCE